MAGIGLHATAYGRPSVELLRDRIAVAKRGDALRPVTVVVPTNYVGVSARRMLAGGELEPVTDRGRGLVGLTLVTVYRLAELLGAGRLAATGRRPVSTPIVAAAIRQVLAGEPGVFADVADQPFTEDGLVRAYRELSEVDDDTLDRLAFQSRRAAEVVRVRREVRALLADDWFEEADLMTAAASAVADGSPVLEDLGTVIVHLPQDLSLPAARLLTTVAERAPVEVIAGRTGATDADADIDRTLTRLGLAPPGQVPGQAPGHAGAQPAFDPPPAGQAEAAFDQDAPPGQSEPPPAPPAATAVVSVSDAEEEARSATSRVIDAARRGVPLERVAILYPHDQPYARLVTEQLEAAGVPYNGRAIKSLAERLLGRWLLDLLALPDRRYERPAVLGLLTQAPVRTADGGPVPAGRWERVSRDAGIVRDRAEWVSKLSRLVEQLRHRADEEEQRSDDPRQWLIDRERRTATQAEALQAFIRELFDRLDAARGLTTWQALAEWTHETIQRYLGGDAARETWPEPERDAAERVESAIDRLAGLDHVAPSVDLPTFRRTLALELDDDLGKVGEFGQGVLVGQLSAGLGVDLDLVIVLGLAEGTLPTTPREDSLLPDSERRAGGEELRLRAGHIGVEHRHLLAALAASASERVLLFPRGDLRRSIERMPSRWLLDTVEALASRPGQPPLRELPAEAASADWYQRIDSFAQRIRTTGFPPTRQEYGLRALAAAGPRYGLAAHPVVADDPALRRGVELLSARAADAFTRFDGNLAAFAGRLPTPADAERAVAVTRLESWLACPHGYFVEHLLRVEPVENPEELLEMTALERGSLVHDVLEQWLAEQLADPPAPHVPWPQPARDRLFAIGEEHCRRADERGVTGHRLLWHRDRQRILADLERFLEADDDRRRQGRLVPVGVEQPFGLGGGGTEAVRVSVDEARSVWLRGRIDRVDRREGGGLVVADYKTGGVSGYRDLGDAMPLGEDGTKLQLAVYALAVAGGDVTGGHASTADPEAAATSAPAVRSEYWFVSTRGKFERKGIDLSDETVAALEGAVRLATDGIAAGLFPLRPPEPQWRPFTPCRYCDPDELGTTDRYRDWERLRRSEALRDYVAHVEPHALADADPDALAGEGRRA